MDFPLVRVSWPIVVLQSLVRLYCVGNVTRFLGLMSLWILRVSNMSTDTASASSSGADRSIESMMKHLGSDLDDVVFDEEIQPPA
jgi:hypothetical protein